MQSYHLTIFSGVSMLLAAAHPAAAKADEVGVSTDTILFGQAAALEGPSAALGQIGRAHV